MDLKIYAEIIEEQAKKQIQDICISKVFENQKIRIMPDVHAGKGCVIGFTSTIGDYIIPNIVGKDISCGMLTLELGKQNINLQKLDSVIRKYIPSGINVHEECKEFELLPMLKCYKNLKDIERIYKSIGTLGGGNHFIELDIDDEDNKYLIIHTGSRNLGSQVSNYYQNLAYKKEKEKEIDMKNIINNLKAEGRQNEIEKAVRELKIKIPNINKELAYLEGKDKEDYLFDVKLCEIYASKNRCSIANKIIDKMKLEVDFAFTTNHNYIDTYEKIIRKGSISAKRGERVLIPLNMRDGCIIAIGKGNKDWNCSAPHGAGRLMSRSEARKSFTLKEYKNSMDGIYTTSINENTIDELPMAYKPMESILNVIGETIEILKIIKPIYNYKDSDIS